MSISFFQLVDLFKANLVGIMAALVLSPLSIWIARRTGLIDIPGSALHKQHAHPTPLAGGIAVVFCSILLLTFFGLWQAPYLAIMAAAGIIFAFGIWDDARGLSAPQKFIG